MTMKMMMVITMMSSGKFMLGYAEKFLYNVLVTRNQYLKIMTRQNFDVSALSRFLVSILVGFLYDGDIYCFFPFILSASSYLLIGSTVACRIVTHLDQLEDDRITTSLYNL